jgi:uncharacterized RDD family membrane protein YckC
VSSPPQIIDPDWKRYGWQAEYEPPKLVGPKPKRPTKTRAWPHILVGFVSWLLVFTVLHGPIAWITLLFGLGHLLRGGWILGFTETRTPGPDDTA